ncbi:MAG: ribose 5-phosphate isomerase B [Clostridiales bacterium 43-6]|nr:MAG: ribose 5-phosphate isomerase B [Clostridiales bacterium 43-6]
MELIALGCDHGGFALMEAVIKHLEQRGIEYKNFGVYECKSVDYPDIALPVAEMVASGQAEKGILICGTGIGMSIAANKVTGIRASVCGEEFSTKFTRLHNDSNILCLGARVTGEGLALSLVDLYIDTPFEGDRHTARVEKITEIERKYSHE